MRLSDPHEKAKILFIAIAVLALLGLLVITLMLEAWRRFNERQSRPDHEPTEPPADAWKVAGERMKPPPAENAEEGEDEQTKE